MPGQSPHDYEGVIGLEVHAELATQTKMFCSSPVVDTTTSPPNSAVCPVCAGLPGVLPVVNRQAVEYGIKAALVLECQIAPVSIFARKNYFYPDLPKGYQISQYEHPLASGGRLSVRTAAGERLVRIRRAHLEEDTGKLTHVSSGGEAYTLVDLNRAGVPLLEIVTEPDMRSAAEVRAFAQALRALLRCLGVNSGDMQKGVIRFEANVSVRPVGSLELGTRVEIKNLNSFRALERAAAHEIERQASLRRQGQPVQQETLGWDDEQGCTFSQRSKEEAHDYRYFPEPDLPPLVVDQAWIDSIRASLPELPQAKIRRFIRQYRLPENEAGLLAEDPALADYYEQVVSEAPTTYRAAAHWITGELFSLMNASGQDITQVAVKPAELADLLTRLETAEINPQSARLVLAEMYAGGGSALEIIQRRGLVQVSDSQEIAALVRKVLVENPAETQAWLDGKTTVANWLFGQVMRRAGGKANPQVIRDELARQLVLRRSRQR